MTTNLSSLGYNMLKLFALRERAYRMPLDIAQKYDQRPFGSMLCRGYIKYDLKLHGFALTDKGYDAYREFETRGILRHIISTRMTHYFEPPSPRKRTLPGKVHIMKEIAATA